MVTHFLAEALPVKIRASAVATAAVLRILRAFICLLEKEFADENLGVSASAFDNVRAVLDGMVQGYGLPV